MIANHKENQMDTFIQPKITGYRQLTQEEAALMNEGKALDEVERLRAFERGVIEAIPGPRYMDPPDGGDVTPLEQVRRMAKEVELLLSANENLQGWLYRSGFVPCDIAACNCGGWHARFGLPERMQEFTEALSDAGHPLTNENGNLPLQALADLIGERDTLREELADASKDAARYRLLRRKFVIMSDGNNAEFYPINLPRPTYIALNTAIELDTALDRERLGMDAPTVEGSNPSRRANTSEGE